MNSLSLFDGRACQKCKVWKPYDGGFYAVKSPSYCKECHRASAKASIANNPERQRENTRAWREAHPERVKAWQARFRDNHREDLRKWQREFYHRNRERRLLAVRLRAQANPEKVRQQKREYYRKNRHQWVVRTQVRRARIKQRGGAFSLAEWEAVKEAQAFTCLHCGVAEPDIKLTVDHIIPLSRGGSNLIANIQALCGPCNSRKHNKLPHELTLGD